MLPGKLYSLGDQPTALDFQIETSRGTGKLAAKNPKTGENFEGTYTGILHGGGVATATGDNVQTRQTTTATIVAPPNYATARGVLIGDKGTSIELFMEIQPGLKPKGQFATSRRMHHIPAPFQNRSPQPNAVRCTCG
jgi:hypothetical protein